MSADVSDFPASDMDHRVGYAVHELGTAIDRLREMFKDAEAKPFLISDLQAIMDCERNLTAFSILLRAIAMNNENGDVA